MENNQNQMYLRYIKSRKANSNSAIGLHNETIENEAIDNYIDTHNRLLENMDEQRRIEKELAERILKLLEE